MVPSVTREEVMAALRDVVDPELRRSIVDLNMVRTVKVEGGVVYVELALTAAGCPLKDRIARDVRERVERLAGVERVLVRLDVMTEEERAALAGRFQREARSRLLDPDSPTRVVAVASGKGGVGKSTVTVNLALALARQGHAVGVLDADIQGFSVPRLLGVTGQPQVLDRALVPLEAHGLQVMSLGFFVEEHTPVIWRGPMLAGALDQFLRDVLWADLDYLLVDLPPGTGDVVLSLVQRLPRARMLLVTTPQAAAYHVAARAAYLARKTGQEILGVVENMSPLHCPHCGHEIELFTGGGADRLAEELGVPVLARIPLEPAVRAGGDVGTPVVVADPTGAAAQAFHALAREVARLLPASASVAEPEPGAGAPTGAGEPDPSPVARHNAARRG